MILFVATTKPPFACGATSVAALVMEESEVEEEFVYAVEPDICEDREAWLMVWLKPGRLLAPVAVLNAGTVFVLESGAWA
jgi:hypothetical protein